MRLHLLLILPTAHHIPEPLEVLIPHDLQRMPLLARGGDDAGQGLGGEVDAGVGGEDGVDCGAVAGWGVV